MNDLESKSDQIYSQGRLMARPMDARETPSLVSGVRTLEVGGERDGLLFIPETYRDDVPSPFVLLLHGAGGDSTRALPALIDVANETRTILLAPDSRQATWDVILEGFGPDVKFIDHALAQTFGTYNVDRRRIAVAGFSDGASYALSLGLSNGDLFSHIMAFSPGFAAPARKVGRPSVFISHGTADPVLPIQTCSRRIVPGLELAGYPVVYLEFDGGHTLPSTILNRAMAEFLES